MSSFEELEAQYQPMIHKIIHSLNIYKNQDEFYQLGLIGLWEAYARFDPEKGDFTNYAYTYIKGLFLTEMTRATRREERTVYPKVEYWESIVDEQTEQPMMVSFLLSFCDGLTDNEKKWVIYTCVDDLSTKEIAEKEGVTTHAVKWWKKRAKEKLNLLDILD